VVAGVGTAWGGVGLTFGRGSVKRVECVCV